MTFRLNQDCIENLFATVRQCGGCRDNPDIEHFTQSLKQCMVKSLITAPKSANCTIVEDFIMSSISTMEESITHSCIK